MNANLTGIKYVIKDNLNKLQKKKDNLNIPTSIWLVTL